MALGRVALDEHSSLAWAEGLSDESPATTAGYPRRSWRLPAGLTITVKRVLPDDSEAAVSHAFTARRDELGIGSGQRCPCRPGTNCQCEWMNQTPFAERAYARPFVTTANRAAESGQPLDYSHRRRPD